MADVDLSKLIITVDDVLTAGYCVNGARRWFPEHNMDFRDFIKNGIDAETFLAKGDHLAVIVVNRKLERESDGRR